MSEKLLNYISSKASHGLRTADPVISGVCPNYRNKKIDICYNGLVTLVCNNLIHVFVNSSHLDSGGRYGPQNKKNIIKL